jgi:excisionase family DNA binding protein
VDGTTSAEARRYLSYTDAAEYTGLSRHSIWRASKRGEISPIRVGTAVRWDRADLDRWLSQRKNHIAG